MDQNDENSFCINKVMFFLGKRILVFNVAKRTGKGDCDDSIELASKDLFLCLICEKKTKD